MASESAKSRNERSRADETLLADVGWLTIQWGRVEAYVDLISAYLAAKFVKDASSVPASFSGRIKFIRKTLKNHAFIGLYIEATSLLDHVLSASRERNELVHGVVTNWSDDGSGSQTHLRRGEAGYVAIQDLPLNRPHLTKLIFRFRVISAKMFNMLEKIKAIVGFLESEYDFWEIRVLQVPHD